MKELTTLLNSYSLSDILIIGILLFIGVSEAIKRFESYKEREQQDRQHYYDEHRQIEQRNTSVENRISNLEEFSRNATENVNTINQRLDYISKGLNNLRIGFLRSQILDFVPESSDHNKFPQHERYIQVFNWIKEYEELIDEAGIENNVMTYSVEKLQEDYEYRKNNNGFMEDRIATMSADKS